MNDQVAKVTLRDGPAALEAADTPSKVIIKGANAVGGDFDEQGRAIKVKKLTAIERMRLFAAAGPELAKNLQWIGLAALACSVVEIDGDEVPKPNSRREIEALVTRLGDDGLNCVSKIYAEQFGIKADDDGDEAGDDVRATAKN